MTKRMNWDLVNRNQRARTRGTESAYTELPPIGSPADETRFKHKTFLEENKLIDESNSAWVDVIVRALSYDLRRKHPSKKRQKLARASVEKLLHSLTQLTEECERKGWKNKNLQYKHRIVRQLRADLGRLLKIDQSLENTKIVKRVQQTIQKIK